MTKPAVATIERPARRDVVFWLLVAIGASTAVAGVVQVVAPGFVLDLLDADRSATSRHLFAIVGMFMACFGGALLQAVMSGRDERTVLLWAGLQKLGAFVAVSLGVANDVFAGLAVLVALNDLASGALILWHRRRLLAR